MDQYEYPDPSPEPMRRTAADEQSEMLQALAERNVTIENCTDATQREYTLPVRDYDRPVR